MAKRLFDILGAGLGLVLFSPLLILLYVLIFRDMGAPVLFRQIRPSLNSKPFKMLKFRSMLDSVGPDGAPSPDAQRITTLPAFYYGTSPNKFFDYIAAGLPVLNNYPGWLTQLITDNDCGYAVPPDDAEALADALEAAAADRKALARKGQAALALARDDFDRNKLGARWIDWVVGASGAQT